MRLALGAAVLVASTAAYSQTPSLSLDQALQFAKQRNGTIKAAAYDLQAAKSGTAQALAAYFPTFTPAYQYNSDRSSAMVNGTRVWQQTEGGSTFINGTWRVLDAGQRDFKYRAARQSEGASRADALQTLRSTLFDVFTQYIEGLRSQELLKVNEAQVQRSNAILDQTKAQVKVGEVAAKEVLQAQADALNAQVTYLTAKNKSATTVANLRSIIGWDSVEPLPALTPVAEPATPSLGPLESYLVEGVRDRADLIAARKRLESLRLNRLLAERNAGPTLTLDTSFDKFFTPNNLESRTLTLTLNGPFFDGGLARAQASQARYQYLSGQQTYIQQERQSRADIESAYFNDSQNAERIKAAASAREAAQANYRAAVESQKAGAANLIDVLTAQVSLATAESNYIEALYDFLESEAKLKLVTGQAVPGEA